MSQITWNTDLFLPVARTAIRRGLADLLPEITSEVERDQFVDDHAAALAESLCETAADRVADLRTEAIA